MPDAINRSEAILCDDKRRDGEMTQSAIFLLMEVAININI